MAGAVLSITVLRHPQSHPRWARRCAGLRSSAALWAAAPVTTREPQHCGVACNISVISRKGMVLCVPLCPKTKKCAQLAACRVGG